MPPDAQQPQALHSFFMDADSICREAIFIISSLPNADRAAVERVCLRLAAVRSVLITLDDPYTSLHNVRIERLWRDVRKGTAETYRQVFFHLEDAGLLDMNDALDRACLYLVFQPRIQASLDRTLDGWNHHKVRTARKRTPVAMFELSRQVAIREGYWTGDPGDNVGLASDPLYGVDTDAPAPPADELRDDPQAPAAADDDDDEVADDDLADEHREIREALAGIDLDAEDGNWGINVYTVARGVLRAAEVGFSDSESE
ncbi:hypothetical protein FA95DRAFT_1504526 [Auriscalpium vulgare]|uniref:Uncharacterized protein n=1 Tax=Auriscalpium vulgare TaxID=40419 RepID=A0ACB8R6L3_9AGAM|nr:hypothetical protein FA95DRAFT_1504526 [Auriscalpium vulgare]